MAISHINGTTLSGISAIHGIADAGLSHLMGQEIGGIGGEALTADDGLTQLTADDGVTVLTAD